MSLPYRSKNGQPLVGGREKMAPTNTTGHHHRPTTKQTNKSFKAKFASKGSLKNLAKGKTESRRADRGKRQTPNQQVMSKIARRNQAKQLRQNHHARLERQANIFQGKDGASKHIAVVPLSPDIDVQKVIDQLNRSLEVTSKPSPAGTTRVGVDRFNRSLLYVPTPFDLIPALDICQLADWVIFVISPDQRVGGESHEGRLGEEADVLIRGLESQGITEVLCVVQGLHDAIKADKRPLVLTSLKLKMRHYFADLDKVSNLDHAADCSNLIRSLCTATPRGIRWRDDRSWMLVESIAWQESSVDSATVEVTGTVRGRPLNPDRLIHLPGWGDFQIGQITEILKTHEKQNDAMEDISKTLIPSDARDDLTTLAPEQERQPEELEAEEVAEPPGVLLDGQRYFEDDEFELPAPARRLPKGTSDYQAAWYLDDVSVSGSEDEEDADQDRDGDISMEKTVPDASAGYAASTAAMDTEVDPSEYPGDADLKSAEDELEDLEEYRQQRAEAAKTDLEYPDEIELHPSVLARERLSKYRGMKNAKQSPWNFGADRPYQPSDYDRLLQVVNYKNSEKAAVRSALVGGAPVGAKVKIEILNVPVHFKEVKAPAAMFGLLQHEHKFTVINLRLMLRTSNEDDDDSSNFKSKDPLIAQIGFRRFVINPIFSNSGSTPNDVHELQRYALREPIASFIGPLTWGAVPALIFKEGVSDVAGTQMTEAVSATSSISSHRLRLLGTATNIPASPSRVIAKRVVLTGHPYKIHRRVVSIRYMFFNSEDVTWFSALPLHTTRGRQGFIKESLGTHGHFKATFDNKISPMEAVAVRLYKRMWPKPASLWTGGGTSAVGG